MPTFPSPSTLIAQFKTILKSLRPDFNVNDPSAEPIIRGRVFTGMLSGVYADQKRVDDDTYIKSARLSGLTRFGEDYDLPQLPATQATCAAATFTGAAYAGPAPADLICEYLPTGALYTLDAPVSIGAGGTAVGTLTAVDDGQSWNIPAGETLQIQSVPTGFDATVTLTQPMAGGSDLESTDSFRARLLQRRQNTPSGGNLADYSAFAFAADGSVRSVVPKRWARGLGTVNIFITAGTNDIDTAVTQGQTISRVPGSDLLAKVQTYYEQNAPLTDAPLVVAPVELACPVTVKVDLASGITLSTVITDSVNNPLNLTVLQLIQREVGRAIYKTPIGGRLLPGYGAGNGFLVASDIENNLDVWLSGVTDSSGNALGKIPVLLDRQVLALDGANTNKVLTFNQLASPGTITVTAGT